MKVQPPTTLYIVCLGGIIPLDIEMIKLCKIQCLSYESSHAIKIFYLIHNSKFSLQCDDDANKKFIFIVIQFAP